MNQYFTDFYNNWTAKAEGINNNNLSSVYDKYITLFVIFNNLYNQIPDKLISLGVVLPDKMYDNKKATYFVIQFLGADNFINELSENNLENDINALIRLMEQEIFHIKLNHGQYDRNEDLKIISELKSSNRGKKAIAILKVAYYVRCNIFHGSKNFQEYQRMLVEPLIRILKMLNPFLFNKLNA